MDPLIKSLALAFGSVSAGTLTVSAPLKESLMLLSITRAAADAGARAATKAWAIRVRSLLLVVEVGDTAERSTISTSRSSEKWFLPGTSRTALAR